MRMTRDLRGSDTYEAQCLRQKSQSKALVLYVSGVRASSRCTRMLPQWHPALTDVHGLVCEFDSLRVLSCRQLFCRVDNGFRTPVNVLFGRGPTTYTDAHRSAPTPASAAEPGDTGLPNPTDHFRGDRIRAKRHQHLVEHDVVE